MTMKEAHRAYKAHYEKKDGVWRTVWQDPRFYAKEATKRL